MRDAQLTLNGRPVWVLATTPLVGDGLQVGDIWVDLFTSTLKRCSSITPVTFVVIDNTGAYSGSVITGTYGGTGVNNGSYTITASANSTISGTNTGDQTITLGGDLSGSGTSSLTATIGSGAVSLGKMANMATASLLGRNTAGTGSPEVLDSSTTKSLLGLVVGTNVQAYDATLGGLAAVASANTYDTIVSTAADTFAYASIPGRNLLINGDFSVGIRGFNLLATSCILAASTTKYCMDRWQGKTNANQAATFNPIYGTNPKQTSGRFQRNQSQTGTGVMRMCQPVIASRCIGCAGRKVTLSFFAKKGANFSPTSGNITVTVYSGTGTTDISGIAAAFTGSATPISTTQALTTSFVKYSFTSSTVGSTVQQLAVEFSWTPVGTAGVDDWAEFTDVQLEISDTATPFERLDANVNIALCAAYYQKTFPLGVDAKQSNGTAGAFGYTVQVGSTTAGYSETYMFSRMRASPTVTYYNPSATNAKWRNITDSTDSGTAATSGSIAIGDCTLVINNPQVVGDLAAKVIGVQLQLDAEIV